MDPINPPGEPDPMMNPEAKRLFLELLRSGYEQTTGVLRAGNCFCAFGLLVEAYRGANGGEWCRMAELPNLKFVGSVDDMEGFNSTEHDGELHYTCLHTHVLPHYVREWAGISDLTSLTLEDGSCVSMVEANDQRGLSFSEIADLVEEQW